MMEEKLYRKIIDDTYDRVDRAFADVDPDLAEVTVAQGALTVLYNQKTKLMLTPQPSVRQLWVAFRDRGWHFDWDADKAAWMDDRKLGIELHKLVEETTKEAANTDVRIV